MGFFTKFRNLVTGKGFREETTVEPNQEEYKEVTEITAEEQVGKELRRRRVARQQVAVKPVEEILPEEIRDVPVEDSKEQPLPNPSEEDKKTLASLPKEDLTPLGQEIHEEEISKKAQKKFEDLGKLRSFAPSEAEIHNHVNKAMQASGLASSPVMYQSTLDGFEAGTNLKQAIINSGAVIDNQIADVIIAHKEVFRSRFNTIIEMMLRGEKGEDGIVKVTFYGSLPEDVEGVAKEEGLEAGASVGSDKVRQAVQKILKQIPSLGGTINLMNIPQGGSSIESIRYGVVFK